MPRITGGKPQGGTGKKKKAVPAKGVVSKKAIAQSNEKMKDMKRPKVSGSSTTIGMPSKSMNKAIPGNKGVNIGAAAKKFIMSTPPVMAARGAAKVGGAVGKAIGSAINPTPPVYEKMYSKPRQMKRLPGTIGERVPRPNATPLPRKAAPGPLDQMRKMNEMPKRQPKKLLPKKSGR